MCVCVLQSWTKNLIFSLERSVCLTLLFCSSLSSVTGILFSRIVCTMEEVNGVGKKRRWNFHVHPPVFKIAAFNLKIQSWKLFEQLRKTSFIIYTNLFQMFLETHSSLWLVLYIFGFYKFILTSDAFSRKEFLIKPMLFLKNCFLIQKHIFSEIRPSCVCFFSKNCVLVQKHSFANFLSWILYNISGYFVKSPISLTMFKMNFLENL